MCFQIPKKIRCGLYVWVSLKPHFLYGMVSKMCCFHRIGWWFLWSVFMPKKRTSLSTTKYRKDISSRTEVSISMLPSWVRASMVPVGHPWVKCYDSPHDFGMSKKVPTLQKSKITKNLWVPGSSRPILPCWLFQHVSIILFSIFTHSWDDDTIDFIIYINWNGPAEPQHSWYHCITG